MKRKNSNNTWLYTICIVLIAIVFGFLSFIPVNIECIKPFIAYFDPTKLLSNLPLWIFTNCIISLYSHSEKNIYIKYNPIQYCLFCKLFTILNDSNTHNTKRYVSNMDIIHFNLDNI